LDYENLFELELKLETFCLRFPDLKPFDFPLGIGGSERSRCRGSSEEERKRREKSAVSGENKGKSPKPENPNQEVFQLKFELKKILMIRGSRIYMVCLEKR
jgi:hypothetical protein